MPIFIYIPHIHYIGLEKRRGWVVGVSIRGGVWGGIGYYRKKPQGDGSEQWESGRDLSNGLEAWMPKLAKRLYRGV